MMFFILLPFILLSPQKQKKLVDEVVAVVDHESILRSELDELVNLYKTQMPPGFDEKQLEGKALDDLIENKILYLEAKKDTTITVTEQEINTYLENQVASLESQWGKDEFERKLKEEGLTRKSFKEKYRKQVKEQLYVQKYVDKHIRPKIVVTPDEVKRFYETHKDSLAMRPTLVRLSHILIRIKPTDSEKNQALKLAQNLDDKLKKGFSFEDLANRFSDDRVSASKGGDLGFLRKEDLPDSIRDEVFALEPGDITKPILTENGAHIFMCVEKTGDAIHLKHILVSFKPLKEDTLQALRNARKILEEINSGEDFTSIAEKYSDDPSSRDFGGDLGWIPVNQLPKVLQDSVESMKINEVRGPVLSEYGFHILKLEDKKEGGKPNFEDVKDDLNQLLYQRKLQDELEKLVKRLKTKVYVEKKI